MSIGSMKRKSAGRSPEARVRWALHFVSLDLGRLSDKERLRVAGVLWAWQTGKCFQPIVPPNALEKTHAELRECMKKLSNREACPIYFPERTWGVFPAPRRVGRRSGFITRQLADVIPPQLVSGAIVFALIDDLNAIGADRLRACPLETDGTPCGVMFLATRNQRYCTPAHAQESAWRAYLARGGEITRKMRR